MLINILYVLLLFGVIAVFVTIFRVVRWLKVLGRLVYNKIRSY